MSALSERVRKVETEVVELRGDQGGHEKLCAERYKTFVDGLDEAKSTVGSLDGKVDKISDALLTLKASK